MRKIDTRIACGIVAMALLFAAGCTGMQPASPLSSTSEISPMVASIADPCGTPLTVRLLAGQTIDAGSVTIANDGENLCVRYETHGGWFLSATHLHIASSLSGIPMTKGGNPIPGQFAYSRSYDPPVTDDEYCFTLAELGYTAGDTIFVAAHAVVKQIVNDSIISQQTGWGEGPGFPGKNWATYFMYTIQECDDDPPDTSDHLYSCETAFGFGSETFIDLGLTTSRWGWQVTVPIPSTNMMVPLYAGAGQNDTTKGAHVGNLIINYDGTTLNVTYSMFSGVVLNETHLYAGFDDVSTTSPGQYGNIHEELDHATADSYSLTLPAGDATELKIVAHAVACVEILP